MTSLLKSQFTCICSSTPKPKLGMMPDIVPRSLNNKRPLDQKSEQNPSKKGRLSESFHSAMQPKTPQEHQQQQQQRQNQLQYSSLKTQSLPG